MAAIIQRLYNKSIVGLKTEGTSRGTYAAPTQSTDTYQLYNFTPTFAPEIKELKASRNSLTLGTGDVLCGAIPFSGTWRVPFKGANLTNSIPFLLMSGLKDLGASGDYGAQYAPDDTSAAVNSNGYSMLCNYDGSEWQVRGLAANARFIMPSSDDAWIELTAQGVVNGQSETAITTSTAAVTYDRAVWELASTTLSDGTSTMNFGTPSVEIDLGNVVNAYRPSSASKGIAYYHVTNRAPTLTAMITAPHNGTTTPYDAELWTALSSNTLCTFTATQTGATKLSIVATGYLTSVQPAEGEGGLLVYNIGMRLASATEGQELIIKFDTTA